MTTQQFINNATLSYTITKTGANTYQMKYTLNVADSVVQQQQNIVVTKTDADGTRTVEKTQIAPMSLATFVTNQAESGEKREGFYANLNTNNLAVGGTLYEIDTVVGYEDPLLQELS